jgi:hypothetical protein
VLVGGVLARQASKVLRFCGVGGVWYRRILPLDGPMLKKSSADLDSLDRKMLARLQREGRISNVDLAEAVGLSESACLRRVKGL